MRILFKTGLGLIIVAALLVGISFNVLRAQDLGAPRDAAARAVASETREVSAAATAVRMEGSIELHVRQGEKPSLVVHAEQRLLPNIVTEMNGTTLRIATRGVMINVRKPIRVDLVLPKLEQLHLHGSGDAFASGFSGEAIDLALHGSGDLDFDGKYRTVAGALMGSGDLRMAGADMDSVDVRIQGSGDMRMRGKAKALKLVIRGSGDFDGDELVSESVNVNVRGSGDANVVAKTLATVDVMGSGDVRVRGNPATRNVTRHGSGDVSFD